MAEDEPKDVFENHPIHAPVVYADGLMVANTLGGVWRLSFVESMAAPLDYVPGWKHRYVGTLVMPQDGFLAMVDYLNRIAADLRAKEGPNA